MKTLIAAVVLVGCSGPMGPMGAVGPEGRPGIQGAPGAPGERGQTGQATHTPGPVWVDATGAQVAPRVGRSTWIDPTGNRWTLLPDEARITVDVTVDALFFEYADCSGAQWVPSSGAGVVVKWYSGDFLRVQSKTTRPIHVVPYAKRLLPDGECVVIHDAPVERVMVPADAFSAVEWPQLNWVAPLHLEIR